MAKQLIIIVLAAALLLACGCGGGNLGSSSSPPTSKATLNVGANVVNFGKVSVGGSKTSSLALSNSASSIENINVSQLSVSGTGFSLASVPALPFVISAGETVTLKIKFAPKSAASEDGSLLVQCDAANPSATVSLSGAGVTAGSQLTIAPPTMNFGSVTVGNSKSQTGSLTASNSAVTVSSADWSGQGYAVSGISFPATVPAGQSISFTVTFTPQVAGSSNGSISFVSDASNTPGENFVGAGTDPLQHSVSLSWDASTSPAIGYNLYRGTQSGGPYSPLTSSPQPGTTFVDASVQSGLTYFYVATSVDSNSVESHYSNQTKAVIPNP